MDYFFTIVLIVHVLVALGIIGLVLLQHGKGADMGAAFGSGSSGSVFGATGSANFLSRATAALAVVFFLTSLGLTWSASSRTKASGTDAGIMGTVKDQKAGDSKSTVPGKADPAKATDIPKPAQDAPKADAGTTAKPEASSGTPEKGSGVPK